MYLLDTVILSELRKRDRDPRVVDWVQSVEPADLFLSAITVGEIELGVEKQRKANPAFADELGRWLDLLLQAYHDRILPLDTAVARRWGRLAGKLGNKSLDLAIAATALEHGLTVATRNVSDFAPTGVSTLDPFKTRRRARRRS